VDIYSCCGLPYKCLNGRDRNTALIRRGLIDALN
jgi:hypothetical protein